MHVRPDPKSPRNWLQNFGGRYKNFRSECHCLILCSALGMEENVAHLEGVPREIKCVERAGGKDREVEK